MERPARVGAALRRFAIVCILLLGLSLLAGCDADPWNNPYTATESGRVVYSSFSERPKHLDPVRSYSSNEYAFIAQIYEPPLQYHYLKRPYQLIPQSAVAVPKPRLLDAEGNLLPEHADEQRVAYSEYVIEIQPGMRYQPHPAFAKDGQGQSLYLSLTEADLNGINTLADFAENGSREVTADDFVYQIKRLAFPRLHSPIAGVMAEYIVGFSRFARQAEQLDRQAQDLTGRSGAFVDLRQIEMDGVRVLDRYRFSIRLKGQYPQFVYWLAMPFFSPMPWEAEAFYSQPGMAERNISLDWYPVGSGPFMLSENNPNLRMVLTRNPNFHGEAYPAEGDPGDREAGLLADAGKPLPLIDKAVYSLEKENIPYWNKFLQGYYDTSGVSSDSFDQAVQFGEQGEISLTGDMQRRGIKLLTAVTSSIFYMGFNMADPVVGGLSPQARKLRQAISIAVDYEEYIAIFANGRGVSAQGPLPPGIFGHREGAGGVNPVVYTVENGKPKRRSIEQARSLLAEAGYPDGRDPTTGKPLTLYFDVTASGPDDRARLNWLRKQFAKLGISLVLRTTDYNRFQEKMRKGSAQIFWWGWNADYPDPENFLFLLYGPNGKVEHGGENAANYANPEFDQLFVQMKTMPNGPERQRIIDRMIKILRTDAPWVWGFHPKAFSLFHGWYKNVKPNLMANNTLKYKRIDAALRKQKRAQWNQPVTWPLWLIGILLLGSIVPAVLTWRRFERRAAR